MNGWRMPHSRAAASVQLMVLLGVYGVACQTAAEPAGQRAAALQSTSTQEGLYDLGNALTAVACTEILTCCSQAEVTDRVHASVTTPDACEQELGPRYTAYVQRIANSFMAGRVNYHGDLAKRCLASLQTQTCSDYALQHFTGPEAGSDCDRWLEPVVPVGSACSDDMECISGDCQGRQLSADGNVSDGKCAAVPGLGQACESACVAGAFCDTTAATPVCIPGQGANMTCSDGSQCQSGICDGPTGNTTCRAAPVSCLGN